MYVTLAYIKLCPIRISCTSHHDTIYKSGKTCMQIAMFQTRNCYNCHGRPYIWRWQVKSFMLKKLHAVFHFTVITLTVRLKM